VSSSKLQRNHNSSVLKILQIIPFVFKILKIMPPVRVIIPSEQGEVSDAQERVLELARSIYTLLAGEDVGIASDALDVARVLKRRETTVSRPRRVAQIIQSRSLSAA
jgi:hypothetical protein